MSLYGSSVEYGLHCLLYLADAPGGSPPSSRDLAEFQGISPSFVAKLFTRLEKAGLVASAEGIGGGFRLGRAADSISVLDVTDALEEHRVVLPPRHEDFVNPAAPTTSRQRQQSPDLKVRHSHTRQNRAQVVPQR